MTPDNQIITSIDQLGQELTIPFPPKRIISVVPSQTELLFNLGLEESIVGVTWFCIHPDSAKRITQVGGTKNLKLEKIALLNPNLIIANKEENDQSQIEWLAERFPVWISDIKNIENACDMILSIGKMTDKLTESEQIIENIKMSFADIKPSKTINTLYLIWREPYMSIGSDTFISNMMETCGLVNMAANKTRYPEFTIEEIQNLNPELILLSSEPYPFKEKHIKDLSAIVSNAKVRLVDGEMFSWYGSRLILAAKYLNEFIMTL